MVDVGCGIGGSSRYLAHRHAGANAQGITLSPVQAERANALAKEQGLDSRVSFKVGGKACLAVCSSPQPILGIVSS